MEWYFVEAPSQMVEELLRVLRYWLSFAHHHKTGGGVLAEGPLITRQ